MSNEFLEERLAQEIRYGSSYSDRFNVDINETVGGNESRRLLNPIPKRYFNIGYVSSDTEIGARVLELYYRVFGKYAGFRVKAFDDYTTNGYIDTPTAFDQELLLVSAGVYQLQKEYGIDSAGLAIGYPTRTIFKPVANTTKIGIDNTLTGEFEQTVTTHWSVATTTGLVTFAANKTKAITGITTGATTLITFGSAHTFAVNDTVHFSSIVGTTQLNSKRATVTAINTGGDNITIGIDSTAYTAWSSGGTVNTRPQSGETVYGGCEFDIPCRFNTDLQIEATDYGIRSANSIELKELITL